MSSDRYKELWEDAFHDNLERKAEISELKAENARLKAEVERLRIAGSESEPRFVLLSDYRHLKAEVERLTAENESLQTKATNIYNAMVVRCKVEEITHEANADSIISQGMLSEAMKLMEENREAKGKQS